MYLYLKLYSHIFPKIPGTKRVDHKRAVKIYERGAGDKTLPSDLRPPVVLKVNNSAVVATSYHHTNICIYPRRERLTTYSTTFFLGEVSPKQLLSSGTALEP
jgi:hypothetical protein